MEELFTRERFLEEGKKEFLEKGFQDTSLRQLCKKLGLTLGAFYGYFKGKEALFEAIVSGPAEKVLRYYKESHDSYTKKNPKEQYEGIGNEPADVLMVMLDCMYEYYDEFKLLFCCSAGTKYELYLEEFIAVEVIATGQFLDLMRENGILSVEIDEQLSHNLASMLFNGMVEIFKHDMTYEHAREYVTKLRLFYTAGWMKLFEG
ncbi:MAG TPA: TetR/AcrR family transcriptional regulator [Clostridiales bacterium]|nr:TetR/AcrR family transcriptional regulator [Clostridiales bacterium]